MPCWNAKLAQREAGYLLILPQGRCPGRTASLRGNLGEESESPKGYHSGWKVHIKGSLFSETGWTQTLQNGRWAHWSPVCLLLGRCTSRWHASSPLPADSEAKPGFQICTVTGEFRRLCWRHLDIEDWQDTEGFIQVKCTSLDLSLKHKPSVKKYKISKTDTL